MHSLSALLPCCAYVIVFKGGCPDMEWRVTPPRPLLMSRWHPACNLCCTKTWLQSATVVNQFVCSNIHCATQIDAICHMKPALLCHLILLLLLEAACC
jgi:hypothetical protein